MGSRVMHYSMAKVLAAKYGYNQEFLLGSIAPDVNKDSKTPKALTHFIRGKRNICPELFLKEYGPNLTQFQLGYYLHLLGDKLWLETVFRKYILNNKNYPKEELLEKYYADFTVLNPDLILKYSLSEPNLSFPIVTNIKEIEDTDLPLLVAEFKEDFIPVKKVSLKVFDKDDIYRYINDGIKLFDAKVSSR